MGIEIFDLVADSESDLVSSGLGPSRPLRDLSLPCRLTRYRAAGEKLNPHFPTSRSRSPSTVTEGHSSRSSQSSSNRSESHHLSGTNYSRRMPRSIPPRVFGSYRIESMADEYWPSDEIEQTRRLGRDSRTHPSTLHLGLSATGDYEWPSNDEKGERHLPHFSPESSRSTFASSHITSPPAHDSETSSAPSTPAETASSQSSQGSQVGSRKRPIDLTDEPELQYFVSKDPAQDNEVQDNKYPVAETIIDLFATDEAVVDLTDKFSRVGETFNIDPADCMTDEEFNTWLPCSPRERSTHEILEADVDGIVCRPSMSLKLHDRSYLRIERIRRRSGQYFFYGRHLMEMTDRRTENYMPKVKGELVWVVNSAGPFSLDEVAGHQNIRFTNERTDWYDHEDLVCRLKMTVRLRHEPPVRRRDPLNADERIIEYLSFDESDPGQRWASTDLRDCWRGPGETVPFGAVEVPSAMPEIIDLEDTSPPNFDLTGLRDRAYTFGDAYSGAGGASCGARQAGLINTWASDINSHAVDTYRRNFDGTIIFHAEFFQLMTLPESELRVDIAHCSPPCQPFSPAHTVNNQTNDERNSACVFTGSDLIKRVRPRVLTMEETNGLHERFKPEFNRIILNFIQDGYSVRWSVLECAYYGIPQYRKRLMIIAAGPGEILPEFPQPTHSLPGGGLKPIETIHRAIDHIPLGTPDHDVEVGLARWQRLGWRDPYNPHQPARTLTCAGGEANYHPSGRRTFTCREVACLQTFPIDFEFSEKDVRKQIGNAVPPKFAEAVFREIRRSLRETDEKELQQRESGALRVGM